MLQCSHCGRWHHFDRVGLKTSDAIGVWPCPRCRQQTAISQGKLEQKNLKQIPYQNIFVPRSCIKSGLATKKCLLWIFIGGF